MTKRKPLPRAERVRHDPDESRYIHAAAGDVNYAIGFVNALIDRVNIIEAELEAEREGKQKA